MKYNHQGGAPDGFREIILFILSKNSAKMGSVISRGFSPMLQYNYAL